VCSLLLLLGDVVLCELSETVWGIERGTGVIEAGNEDVERAVGASLWGRSRQGGLYRGLRRWWLEGFVHLARQGRMGTTVGLAAVCPAEGISLVATGGANGALGSSCRHGEGRRLVQKGQRRRRQQVCGESRVGCANGRGDTQVPELDPVAMGCVVALNKEL
jgi:hypothetical protein